MSMSSPETVAAFAPRGRLRVAINLGNPILAHAADGPGAAGVSVDLARALAAELDVDVELVCREKAALSVEAVRTGEADLGFFAVDPARSDGLSFSAPYVLIEGSYLVPNAAAIDDIAQVDKVGTTIGVGRGSAYDLFLSRDICAATIERLDNASAVRSAVTSGQVQVAAGIRQLLQGWAEQDASLRLLPGRFMVIEQAMAIPTDRGTAAAQALADFVERMKATGFVADALSRHGIEGASVAPAA